MHHTRVIIDLAPAVDDAICAQRLNSVLRRVSSAYCASKAAVLRLTESLSEEVKHRGVNVNAVLPSIIDTPANRAAMPAADQLTGLPLMLWCRTG